MNEASTHPAPRSARAAARAEAAASDLQTVLTHAVARLCQSTGCSHVAVWGARSDGTPYVIAATPEAAGPSTPDPGSFRALVGLPGASDLGKTALPDPAQRQVVDSGFAAAVRLGASGEEANAVLLVGGAMDKAGGVRPRTLAALDEAARRLSAPVDATAAAARLAALDLQVRRLGNQAALGELIAEIVHEIRNPLVSVKTFLQLLPDRMDDSEFRTRFFEVASDEVRRIERLLNLVLLQARPESAALEGERAEPEPIFEAVERLLAHRALERAVSVERKVAPGVGLPMNGDALRQVVLNLTINALDVTPAGGTIRLVTRAGTGRVELAVEDQGPGIPRALRERIFEPFFSTKQERPGGLGLAIARRMVVESGGEIIVKDRPGGGTRIVLAWEDQDNQS